MRSVHWTWLGQRRYEDALLEQRAHRAAVIAGDADEALWLLEHDSVITTGRRSVDDLPSEEVLSKAKTRVVHTERGGLATWHGPGQLMAYAIVDAWGRGLGARGTVCAMETGVINFLSGLGICAARRTGYPGVWVGQDKICAVGMHFSRGISMHGIALNLARELPGFDLILPCGIEDGGITSVGLQMNTNPQAAEMAPGLGLALQAAIDAATREKAPSCAPKGVDVSHPER